MKPADRQMVPGYRSLWKKSWHSGNGVRHKQVTAGCRQNSVKYLSISPQLFPPSLVTVDSTDFTINAVNRLLIKLMPPSNGGITVPFKTQEGF